jgi:hypothetical protein
LLEYWNIGLLSFKCAVLRLHHSTIVISLGRNRVYDLQRFERFERLQFGLLQAVDPYESAKFTLRSLRIIRTLAPFAPLQETLPRNSFPAKTLSSRRPLAASQLFFAAPTLISPNLVNFCAFARGNSFPFSSGELRKDRKLLLAHTNDAAKAQMTC